MNPTKYSSEYLVAVIVSVLVLTISNVQSELTPPYFNLAEGRHITATATCGVGSDGPELYCKLVGANTEHDNNQHDYKVIQGQVRNFYDFVTFIFGIAKKKRSKISQNLLLIIVFLS